MSGTSSWQFGLIVAYVLPGFIGLAGLTPFFPAVASWLRADNQGGLGLGPPMYAVFAAAGLGLILSCFRWLILDQIHRWTGVERPTWDDRQLAGVLGAFDYLVQNHYRYYEFCGNTLTALLFAYGINRLSGRVSLLNSGTDVGLFIVSLVLFAASRDALSKYYQRTQKLLGVIATKESVNIMFNGNDHGGASSTPHQDAKPAANPKAPAETPKTVTKESNSAK
jgi:hypothetical protein